MFRRFHDDCRILQAARLYRAGCLIPGHYTWEWDQIGSQPRSTAEIVAEAGRVTLRYRLTVIGEDVEQRVAIITAPCVPTSGLRWFFECPTCGTQRRKLYSPPGCLFGCVDCYGITYRSVWTDTSLQRKLRVLAQVGAVLEGHPADGTVPSGVYALRRKRQIKMRARLRDLLAIAALELMRDDDASGDRLY
jgi:hypothetical protein